MSTVLRVMTILLFGIPAAFVSVALSGKAPFLWGPALLVAAIYGHIWLRMRPTRFVVDERGVEVVWPLRREIIPRARIAHARILDREALRQEAGWGMRVGAGGLWGGFGWLYTSKRGVVRMYISELDRFVWIETTDRKRPWMITPEEPEAFVRTLG